jgi:ketosteroid isomerase-like protein
MIRHAIAALFLIAAAPDALWAQSSSRTGEEEIKEVVRQYYAARAANDTTAAGRILAYDYSGISSNGVIGDRRGALRVPMNVTPVGQQVTAFTFDSLHVRLYGTTAVVTGIRQPRYTNGSVGAGVRFTAVLVRRDDRWQIVALQSTDRPRGS